MLLSSCLPKVLVRSLEDEGSKAALEPKPPVPSKADGPKVLWEGQGVCMAFQFMHSHRQGAPDAANDALAAEFATTCHRLARVIAGYGGEVVRFGGGETRAGLALWRPGEEEEGAAPGGGGGAARQDRPLQTIALRAVTCASRLVSFPVNVPMGSAGALPPLCSAVGIASGTLQLLRLGGLNGEYHYLMAGPAAIEASHQLRHTSSLLDQKVALSKGVAAVCEKKLPGTMSSSAGDASASPGPLFLDVSRAVQFEEEESMSPDSATSPDSGAFWPEPSEAFSFGKIKEDKKEPPEFRAFVPACVTRSLELSSRLVWDADLSDPSWDGEVRPLSLVQLSANVLDGPSSVTNKTLETVVWALQKTASEWNGVILGLDFALPSHQQTLGTESSSNCWGFIATVSFGIPGSGCGEDFALHACLASLSLAHRLQQKRPSLLEEGGGAASLPPLSEVEVAAGTGRAFAGLVGTQALREYAVVGQVVGETARLLEAVRAHQGHRASPVVVCTAKTQEACQLQLDFTKVQSKSKKAEIFCPYQMEKIVSQGLAPRDPFEKVLALQLGKAAVSPRPMNQNELSTGPTIAGPQVERPQSQAFVNSGRPQAVSSAGGGEDGKRPWSWPRAFSSRKTGGARGAPGLASHQRDQSNRPRPSTVQPRPHTLHGTPGLPPTPSRENPAMMPRDLIRPLPPFPESSGGPADESLSASLAAPSPHPLCGKEIVVHLPDRGLLSNAAMIPGCPVVGPAGLEQAQTFLDLLAKVFEVAKERGFLRPNQARLRSQDFVLNIRGTRLFLPNQELSIRHLQAFVQIAQPSRERPDAEQSVELIFVLASERAEFQTRLDLAKASLLQAGACFVDRNTRSTLLVEGQAGIGKSHLLSQFSTSPVLAGVTVYRAHGLRYPLVSDALRRAGRRRRAEFPASGFGPFGEVLRQYLDSKLPIQMQDDAGSVMGTSAISSARTQLLAQELSHCRECKCVGFLNQLLGTSLPVPEKEEGGLMEVVAILYYLLWRLSEAAPSAIVIDSADCLDEGSWLLLLSIAAGHALSKNVLSGEDHLTYHQSQQRQASTLHPPLPVLVVVAFRPFAEVEVAAKHDILSLLAMKELLKNKSVQLLKLNNLSPEQLKDLVRAALSGMLGAGGVSDSIVKFIEQRSSGHPGAALQLVAAIQALLGNAVPTSRPKRNSMLQEKQMSGRHNSMVIRQVVSRLVESLDESHLQFSSQFLNAVDAQLDSFEPQDLLVVKIASLLDTLVFSASLIEEIHPVKSLCASIEDSLCRLTAAGVLVLLNPYFVEHQGFKEDEKVYSFAFWFHKHTLRSRLLGRQAAWLRDKIYERQLKNMAKLELVPDRQRVYSDTSLTTTGGSSDEEDTVPQKMNEASAKIKSGIMYIRKQQIDDVPSKPKLLKARIKHRLKRTLEGATWKQRHCVLSQKTLSMFKDSGGGGQNFGQSSSGRVRSDKMEYATQVVFMEGACVQMEMSIDPNRPYTFKLSALKYMKDGKVKTRQRNFFCDAGSSKELESWVAAVRQVIQETSPPRRLLSRTSVLSTNDSESVGSPYPRAASSVDMTFASTRFEPPEEGLRLVLQIQEMRDICSPPAVYGMSLPICELRLDKKRRFTREGRVTSPTSFSFGCETVSFDLSQTEWLQTNLFIKVLRQEPFLPAHCMGQAAIPLCDITPTAPTLSNQAEVLDTTCLLLHDPLLETSAGQLLICVRLILSAKLSNEAWELGSVEDLRMKAAEDLASQYMEFPPKPVAALPSPMLLSSYSSSETTLRPGSDSEQVFDVGVAKVIPLESLRSFEVMLANLAHDFQRYVGDETKAESAQQTSERIQNLHSAFKEMVYSDEHKVTNGVPVSSRADGPRTHFCAPDNPLVNDDRQTDCNISDSLGAGQESWSSESKELNLNKHNYQRRELLQKESSSSSFASAKSVSSSNDDSKSVEESSYKY